MRAALAQVMSFRLPPELGQRIMKPESGQVIEFRPQPARACDCTRCPVSDAFALALEYMAPDDYSEFRALFDERGRGPHLEVVPLPAS